MPRLTKRICDAAIASAGTREAVIWDHELPGFGLRIKSGTQTFLVQYRNAFGRSRRLSFGRYGVLTADGARKEARRLLADVAKGVDVAEKRVIDRAALTVGRLCDEYLAAMDAGDVLTRFGKAKKTSTMSTDGGRIARHIRPLLGHRVVADLTSADVARFRSDVKAGRTATDVKTGKKRGRAIVKGGPGTATRTLGLLSGIMAYAKERGYRSDNPVHGVKRDASGKRKVALSAAQYAALGAALARSQSVWQSKAAIVLTALTGGRRGEIETLPIADVHLDGHCLALSDSKTGFSIRPIGRPVIEILRALAPYAHAGYVLPSIRKVDSHYGGLPGAWDALRKEVPSLKGVTLRDLRRSFSTVADELGVTIPTIGGMIGHTGGGVTEGYIVKAPPALIAAADLVSKTIMERLGIASDDLLPHRIGPGPLGQATRVKTLVEAAQSQSATSMSHGLGS